MGNVVYVVDSGRGRTAALALGQGLVDERPRLEDGVRPGRPDEGDSLSIVVEGDDNPVKTLDRGAPAGQHRDDPDRAPPDGGSRVEPAIHPARSSAPERDHGAAVVRPVLGILPRSSRRSTSRATDDVDYDVDGRPDGNWGAWETTRHRRRLRGVRPRRVPDQRPGPHALGGEGTGYGQLPARWTRLHVQARRRTAAADPHPRDLAAANERRGAPFGAPLIPFEIAQPATKNGSCHAHGA